MPEIAPRAILRGKKVRPDLDLEAPLDAIKEKFYAECLNEHSANKLWSILSAEAHTVGDLVGALESWHDAEFCPWIGVGQRTLQKLVRIIYETDACC